MMIEQLLKPIMWLLWSLFCIVIFLACVYFSVWGEIVFWRWNWIVALSVHLSIAYAIAVIYCDDVKWPWEYPF